MTSIVAIFLFLIFLFLSALHVYWGFGGKAWSKAVYPKNKEDDPQYIPGPIPTFIVAIGLLLMGLFILLKAGFFNLIISSWLNVSGLWIIASIFIFRAIGDFNYLGLFKKVKGTQFAKNDTCYYAPLCLLMGTLTLILLL